MGVGYQQGGFAGGCGEGLQAGEEVLGYEVEGLDGCLLVLVGKEGC